MSKVYSYVQEKIISLLDQNIVPWRKPWNAQGFHRNGISGKAYRGINVFITLSAGFDSPFWYTMKQIRSKKSSVPSGEKSTQIYFFSFLDDKKDPTGKKKIPIFRYYNVWNQRQLPDMPEPTSETVTRKPFQDIDSAEKILEISPMKADMMSFGFDRACYIPAMDKIQMPTKESFPCPEKFYNTLFHEMGHATGHASRLKRDLSGIFGNHSYSKEELIAEMTAAFLCGVAGIEDNTLEHSAAYIQSWRKKLSDDPKLIVQAGSAAQKAADYILGVKFSETT